MSKSMRIRIKKQEHSPAIILLALSCSFMFVSISLAIMTAPVDPAAKFYASGLILGSIGLLFSYFEAHH
jgi:hypothetical protein